MKLETFEKTGTFRRIRTTALGIVALAGVGGFVGVGVEANIFNSRIERSVQKDVPGYDPDTFKAMQKIDDRFREEEDLTSPIIKVPEDVRQAATQIKDGQVIFDKGNQLREERVAKFNNRFTWKLAGAIVLILAGGIPLITSSSKGSKQEPEKAARNSSHAKA